MPNLPTPNTDTSKCCICGTPLTPDNEGATGMHGTRCRACTRKMLDGGTPGGFLNLNSGQVEHRR